MHVTIGRESIENGTINGNRGAHGSSDGAKSEVLPAVAVHHGGSGMRGTIEQLATDGNRGRVRLVHLAVAVALLVPAGAMASPGATDASGCHRSASMGYHCHPIKPGAMGKKKAQAATAEERRLKRECKGRPNAGACLGYAR